MPTMTQLPNGRWVPAQPLPFYRDTRPVYVKLWHVIKGLSYLFFTIRGLRYLSCRTNDRKVIDAWQSLKDKLEAEMDKWLVPVE